ncbi:HD domain-containing phosphohydrolase [Dongia sp.]|uniref:HD domain-containing phosphohydrolase n=1 Tax=Dongia sp. TaxID=1977262 RepID=UPI0035AECFDF
MTDAERIENLTLDGLRAALHRLPHGIAFKDVNSVIVFANESYANDIGAPIDELVGRKEADFLPAEIGARYREDDLDIMRNRVTVTREDCWEKNGETRWIRTTKAPVFGADGSLEGVILIYRDMTEKRQAKDELLRQHWALQAISRSNRAMVSADGEEDFLNSICAALTADNRYSLAWVGWAEHDAEKTIRIIAKAGVAQDYLDGLNITWDESPSGRGPTGSCIREDRVEVHNKLIDEAAFAPWRERALNVGIRASVSIPIHLDGRVAGAIVIYGNDFDVFSQSEVTLFKELADNIAFGIEARRMRAAHDAALKERTVQAETLEHALEDALAAVAAMLEQRDPYTAGHQRSVADLAVAIGRELGMSPEQLKALHLAGIVHDIGKIRVPAEILTKPGRLNPIEFAIVKKHPETGYQLLKGIKFPWPVADIVHQHHEAMDGSGYPRGLKAGDIMLEARIMSVADIVESMSSDRPYRPALGLDRAREEILRQKGSRLDDKVVDACIRVLARGDFSPSQLSVPDEIGA